MSRNIVPDRRAFLKASGLGAAALPLLHAERALGAGCRATGPRRFLMIVFADGCPRGSWFPTTTGADFTLPPALKPFEPLRRKMITLDGLAIQGEVDLANAGHLAYPALTTGRRPARQSPAGHASVGSGISIDQYIGEGLARTVQLPRKTLYLGALNNNGATGAITSYLGAERAVTPEEDPNKLFAELFAGLGNTTAADPAAQSELMKLQLARKSVVDHVTDDLERFQARLGTEDRDKIAFHLDSVRELERQTSLSVGNVNLCGARPVIAAGINYKDPYAMDRLLPAQLDIAVGALAADVTRVVNLTIGDSWADMIAFPWLGPAHQPTGHRGGTGGGDAGGWHRHSHDSGTPHVQIVTWLMTQIAAALTKMDSIAEGNGTLLDNTAVLVMSNMETGGHNCRRLPALVFGSCGGQFTLGRAINVGGKPHNGLLAAMANAVGVPTPQFGDPAYGNASPGLSEP